MAKNYFAKFLAVITALLISTSTYAAPGDTTWVQANVIPKIEHYGAFDTVVNFPDGNKTYRKILMVYTLGEYACAAGSQYCHQWDYTVTNSIITATDTFELSRFITPFATNYPLTWKHNYNFDVTDFYNQLKNSATIRMFYSGYSWGFSANIKFAFIEGVPPRNVIGIKHLWEGSPSFGNDSDPIDNYITAKSITPPANTQSSELRFTITGHGADNTTGCCEFNNIEAGHDYYLNVNGINVATKNVFRGDCAVNQIYPQGGTWLPNRGGWCPGASVDVNTHILPLTTGANTVDVDFESYSGTPGTNGYGSYTISGDVLHYSNFNHVLDASIENVVAPTNDANFFRENPSANRPIIRVKNTGSTTITSIKFLYNVKDSAIAEFTWNGNLLSLKETDITLASLNTLSSMSFASASGVFVFEAKIVAVNGATDEDATNNSFKSSFIVAPTWPTQIIVSMKTNNQNINGSTSAGQSETTWKITDLDGNIYAERSNAQTGTLYNDTVNFATTGTYKFTINDGSCDGLRWWYYAAAGINITTGYLNVKKKVGGSVTNIPMNGYSYSGTYSHDFGCTYNQFFTTIGDAATGISNIEIPNLKFEIYPNPAINKLTLVLDSYDNTAGQIKIIDALGQIVISDILNSQEFEINTSSLKAGIYSVIYSDSNKNSANKKLVILK